ncbi:MAG: CPBP family intramembrane glutamic endopeptidase [Patescibacteria group bacterium]
MNKKEKSLKNLTIYITYLVIFWGFYRLLIKLPDQIEEIFIKPFFWLLPLIHLLKIEKEKISSLGISLKNLFPAVYLSLGLGSLFVFEGLLANYIKYGGLNFSANLGDKLIFSTFALSVVTAIVEEITFRGYIFNRIWKILGKEIPANLVTTFFWTLIHVPIVIFVWKYPLLDSVIYLSLTAIFGAGSSFIFARTQNIVSSILLHVLWEWPIILFR